VVNIPSLALALRCVVAPCALVSCGFIDSAHAQVNLPGTLFARSHSGQFSICAVPTRALAPRFSNLETNENLARLDPTLLPTSCERIKQILYRELGATTPWRDGIFLVIIPARSAEDLVTIVSEQFRDRWQYSVELPEVVDRSRYVRAMVQVLLLEMANRNARARSAEIPAWLMEGLTQELLASSSKDELIPPPPRPTSDIMRPASTFTVVEARKANPLELAHKQLCLAQPLTFQELSWPALDQVDLTVSDVYRDSALLFVNQLLALRDGRACLRTMLEALPDHFNWQFAFLRAFRSYFQRPLDVEKWWALQVVHFTGRDLTQTFPLNESWQKLDEIIRSEVQVRMGTNEMPMHAEVPLQTIVGEWNQERQTQALHAKLQQLELLRPRVAQELIPLVDEYRRVITTYLQNRDHVGFVLPFRKKAAVRHAADQALRQLAVLDQQRLSMRPPSQQADALKSKPEAKGKEAGPAYPNQARSER